MGPMRFVSVFMLAVLSGPTASAQSKSINLDDVKRHTSCVLRITSEGSPIPVSVGLVNALLGSPAVLDRAVDEGSGTGPGAVKAQAIFSTISSGARMQLGKLTLYIFSDDPGRRVAEQLLRETCARLDAALKQAADTDRQQLIHRLASAREEYERTRQEYAELQERALAFEKQAGRSDLNRDHIAAEIHELTGQKRDLQLELEALSAREHATLEQVARLRKKMESGLSDDEVLHELETVLELKTKEIERLRQLKEQKLVGDTEVNAALVDLARARAEIAERREQSRARLGADRLEGLNEELAHIAVEADTVRVHLDAIERQLKQIAEKNVLEIARKYEIEVALQTEIVRNSIAESARRVREIHQRIRALNAPSLLILGDRPAK